MHRGGKNVKILNIHSCMNTYAYMNVYTYMHTYSTNKQTTIRTYIHACVQMVGNIGERDIYMHPYIHTYINTYIPQF